jgi:hypothetical protein
MGARFRGDWFVTVEVDEDRLRTDEWLHAWDDEDGDRFGAGALAQEDALVLLDRHLASQVVDAELGQPLPHAA